MPLPGPHMSATIGVIAVAPATPAPSTKELREQGLGPGVWTEVCRFPGHPPVTVTFDPLQPSTGQTIRFSSQAPVVLKEHANDAVGTPGHVYVASRRDGRFFVFAFGAEGGPGAARLYVYPSESVYMKHRSSQVAPLNGICRPTSVTR